LFHTIAHTFEKLEIQSFFRRDKAQSDKIGRQLMRKHEKKHQKALKTQGNNERKREVCGG